MDTGETWCLLSLSGFYVAIERNLDVKKLLGIKGAGVGRQEPGCSSGGGAAAVVEAQQLRGWLPRTAAAAAAVIPLPYAGAVARRSRRACMA